MTMRTVGEIAAETPASIRVFEKYKIDYCCGGATPIEEACAGAGITVETFLAAIESSAVAPEEAGEWSGATLIELREHLVARYHVHAREELETLQALSAKVLSVHGERHPELSSIVGLVDALQQDMLPHMVKEEMILFPYVDQLELGGSSSSCFGTVANPIRVMLMEHEVVGDLLRELRRTSSDYSVPADACFSYRELYRRLADFERETHQHIHLENNIYFPRALEIESRKTA